MEKIEYRKMLKKLGITEEQVAQAMGYKSASVMRNSSRAERAREHATNLFNLFLQSQQPAGVPVESPHLPLERFLALNPAKFLTFYQNPEIRQVMAITNLPYLPASAPNYGGMWGAIMTTGGISAVGVPAEYIGSKWKPCEHPCAAPVGAELVQALMPWHSWQKFVDQIQIENKYDGILSFRLEYEPDVVNQLEGAELPVPFGSTDNVLAVLTEDSHTCLAFDPVDSWFGQPNYMPTNTATAYTRQNTREIDEKTARIVCPELFKYLDSMTTEEILSKKH